PAVSCRSNPRLGASEALCELYLESRTSVLPPRPRSASSRRDVELRLRSAPGSGPRSARTGALVAVAEPWFSLMAYMDGRIFCLRVMTNSVYTTCKLQV